MTPLRPAVVLVADRTLSADYRILFDGIFATLQTTRVPSVLMRHFVAPPVRSDAAGRARAVPLGLARVEAALLSQTALQPSDIVCATPEALPRLLGPWVKIVGVSSSDPLGLGMSNTTTSAFMRGELYTRRWNRELLEQLRAARQAHPFKVIVGGAGAWQWRRQPDALDRLAIDTVWEGYFEAGGPGVIIDLLADRSVPRFTGNPRQCAGEAVRPIRTAASMGVLELSRGCGKGCRFCAMAHLPMEHIDAATILADLATNTAAGIHTAVSGSEDFFRYGGTGPTVNCHALLSLLNAMHGVHGLDCMQIDHANIASVLQFTDAQLQEIRRLLTFGRPMDYLWLNLGIESANGRLVQANCPGKMFPFRPEDWEEMVHEAAERLSRNGFFPAFSIVLGLPGETPDDVARTRRLVDWLTQRRAIVFPIFLEPVRLESGVDAFTLTRMRADHLALFRACYEINFRWVPRVYWDNQRAGGVGWVKRALMQVMGRGEVHLWRHTFRQWAARMA